MRTNLARTGCCRIDASREILTARGSDGSRTGDFAAKLYPQRTPDYGFERRFGSKPNQVNEKQKMCSSFQGILLRRVRYQFGHPWFAIICLLGAAALAPSRAFAACAPATGDNVTVTCSGATLNQGPEVNTGYGSGLQTGLTISVQAPASVIGTAIGIDVGDNNTVNNLGTITTAGGNFWGINGGAALTVINSGTVGNLNDTAGINAGGVGLMVVNNASGVISGQSTAIQGAGLLGVGTATVINFGLIQGTFNAIDGGSGFLDVTNNVGGIIAVDYGSAINNSAFSVKVTNAGTISTTPGLFGTAISAGDTATVTNLASGLITADSNAITAQKIVLTNAGTISGTGLGASALSGGIVSATNSGSILSVSFAAISMSTGIITNNAGGVISGDSGIDTFGTTSIFNAGTITGAGGTAISFFSGGNTLTLAPGSVINGTAHGFGADTFQLGGTGTASFDAGLFATQFSGYAIFNKIGASSWTLTGTNATAMPWTISAGTLNVNGTLANSAMMVNGGTLGGTGTVGSTTVNNGGTFAPGNGTPGTFMTVNGNLAFQSGALYLLQLDSAASTLSNVTGTAALAGTVQVTSPTNSFRFNSLYTILTSGGLGGSRFNALATPAGIMGSLIYTGNNVVLNLTSGLGQLAGNNANQRAVGSALDAAFNAAGGVNSPFGAIFAGNIPQNLTQLSGELATGSQQTTFDAMNLFLGLLTDPFVAGRGDGAAGGAGATPFAEEDDGANAYGANGNARSKGERDAYGMITKAPPRDHNLFDPRWSIWAAGFGGSQTTDGNATLGSNTATSRIAGAAVGADYRFSPFTIAGFALAGGGTNFSIANGLGTGRSDLFQAGAFVRHNVGPAYISGALAYGWQDITTDRTVTIAGVDRLRAEFNANAFSGRLEGGYRFVTPWMNGIGITPYAAGQFTTFDLPDYAEQVLSGANTFALANGSKSVTDTRSELGLRTDKSFAVPNAILTLRGRFAWAHDFNPDRSIAATFQTLPGASFVVNGAAQAHDSALITASAEIKWLNGWSAAATFEGEFSDVTRSHAGKGVVRYAW